MLLAEEFKVKNAAGRTLVLQKMTKGMSFIDFGMTRLPRDFEGYSVMFTDQIAEPRADGSFKVNGIEDVFKRI